jgi:hypothetical protein
MSSPGAGVFELCAAVAACDAAVENVVDLDFGGEAEALGLRRDLKAPTIPLRDLPRGMVWPSRPTTLE